MCVTMAVLAIFGIFNAVILMDAILVAKRRRWFFLLQPAFLSEAKKQKTKQAKHQNKLTAMSKIVLLCKKYWSITCLRCFL